MITGYRKNFIGDDFEVPLPRLTPAIDDSVLRSSTMREEIYLDYLHYTVVMNKATRQPVLTALNIDQALFRKTNSKANWRTDSRAGRDNQLNNDYYRKNDWDKGHMVMRWNTSWGVDDYEAQMADDESYYYTNAAFQHMNFNRDEWLALENDVVRKFSDDDNDKLCVFTGPIHGELDRHYERGWHDSVRIPSGFFKIICYKPKPDANYDGVGVKAFVIYQDEEMILDQKGARNIKFANYQETVRHIEELTGLDFGRQLFNSNPMMYFDAPDKRENLNIMRFPESRLITHREDIIDHEVRPYSVESQKNRSIAIVSAMINPIESETENEWVALLNRTNKTIKLSNWTLSDEKNATTTLKGSIEPGSTKTIQGEELYNIRLRNIGGALKLFDSKPCMIDHVTWSRLDASRTEGRSIIFS